jgi:MarR family transcriptional regulator, transcriptional regulator for hemolysin
MENLEEIIFYSLERSIKTYRQFAQRNINFSDSDITIDQWLVMKVVLENSEMKQNEIAEKVFKDAASVTRIIELLIKKEYLSRKVHDNDRRRTSLKLTKKGKDILAKVQVVINKNRASALNGIDEKNIKIMRDVLSKITYNCRIEES